VNTFPPWAWVVFACVVAVLLPLDLLAHRHDGEEEKPAQHAVAWSLLWIGAGLAFGVFVWVAFGAHPAQEYFAAYLIEKSLSVDNLFVFVVIFDALRIAKRDRRRVLTWGILGALVSRAILVFAGISLLDRFPWIGWVFGALLLWGAWHMLRHGPAGSRESRLIMFLSNHLPLTKKRHGGKFFAKENAQLVATPLFVAVLAIEISDVVFALDSVPAALSVTRNGFIVFTSNVFAVLGLRALYVVLIGLLRQVRYLSYGLAAILAFAGVKMLLPHWLEIPPVLSVTIIVVLLGVTVLASLWPRRRWRET
jgi:tellurite resistance protein TerC